MPAGSGVSGGHTSRVPPRPLDASLQPIVDRTFAERRHAVGGQRSALDVHTASGSESVAVLDTDRPLSETDRSRIARFTSRLSIAFDTVILYETWQRADVGLEPRVVARTAEPIRANRRLALQRSDLRRAASLETEIPGTIAHDLKKPRSR